MKYVYLLLGVACLVAMTILYFQMIVSVSMQVPFFQRYIPISVFMLYIMILALWCGVLITVGIKSFLSSTGSIDDDFDL